MNSIIKYTSRDYDSVMSDINNNDELADTPDWWKKMICGIMDVINIYINMTANQTNPYTAFTRNVVSNLLALIDYTLTPHSTSSGNLLFDIDNDASLPITILKSDLIALTQGSLSVSSKQFESRSDLIFSLTQETFTTDYITNDYLTVSRIYTTGEKIRLSTTDTLPTPFYDSIDYYVIYVSDTTIMLADTRKNAFAGTNIEITDDGTGTHSIKLLSATVEAYQQISLTDSVVVGSSDGVTAWQEFDLNHQLVLNDEIEVIINSETWTRVDNWQNSESDSLHYRLLYYDGNNSKILFGNDVYGKIPGAFDIEVTYSYGGGIDSNISTLNKITVYGGSNSNITGVTNSTKFTGGSDEETISSGVNNAPILLKSGDRFITVSDGEALVNSYAGVANSTINRLTYGNLSCQVIIIPDGGGLPSSALKTALQTYLINKTILKSIDVRVEDPTYVDFIPTLSIKMLTGYNFSDYKKYIVLALRLSSTERGKEIFEYYETNGITLTITLLNAEWGTSFTEDDDGVQIETLLKNFTYTIPGENIEESDIYSFLDNYIDGIDNFTISSPSFPFVIESDECSTDAINESLITEAS